MAYTPIEDYGIIGDMHSVALVGMNGSIDWLCFPHFDSPSIFGAILDEKKGGHFSITPTRQDVKYKQIYLPETNILITRFLSVEGVGEITDFMPVHSRHHGEKVHQVVRKVTVVRDAMKFRMECKPAFDYARQSHTSTIQNNRARFHTTDLQVELVASVPMQISENAAVTEFKLQEGESAFFIFQDIIDKEYHDLDAHVAFLFDRTVAYWRDWLSKCTYKGRWREMVYRSALTLKLLTFEQQVLSLLRPHAVYPKVWEAPVIGTIVSPGYVTPLLPCTPCYA